eukprot:9492623-Pyramimonas_sp.AAC.2
MVFTACRSACESDGSFVDVRLFEQKNHPLLSRPVLGKDQRAARILRIPGTPTLTLGFGKKGACCVLTVSAGQHNAQFELRDVHVTAQATNHTLGCNTTRRLRSSIC